MCNHLYAVNCCHGSEREEVHATELALELQRTTLPGQYVHRPATLISLDWFDYCPRCGTPLAPLVQLACDLANALRK